MSFKNKNFQVKYSFCFDINGFIVNPGNYYAPFINLPCDLCMCGMSNTFINSTCVRHSCTQDICSQIFKYNSLKECCSSLCESF